MALKTEEIIKESKHYNAIQFKEYKDFVAEAIKEYATEDKVMETERVLKVCMGMLERKGQLNPNARPAWIDVLVTGAYIHNLFYDGTLTSLFKAREVLTPMAKKHKIPFNAIGAIFQVVETQFGPKTPIEQCIPSDASPNMLFSWACWFIEEFQGTKKPPVEALAY